MQLQKEYTRTIPEKLACLEQLIQEVRRNLCAETLTALRFEIHKMAGNAGTYGYPRTGNICKQFDVVLIQKIESIQHSPGNPDWIPELEAYLEKIKKGIAAEGKSQEKL